ncbi:MAG: CDP-alcohol phosphatidyltransferase family protein [Vicinamibacterales bacterium]
MTMTERQPIALILTDGVGPGEWRHVGETAFAGRCLVERAALAARHAGIIEVVFAGDQALPHGLVARLARAGVTVRPTGAASTHVFAGLPPDRPLVVLPVDTIAEPDAIRAVLTALADGSDGAAAVVLNRVPGPDDTAGPLPDPLMAGFGPEAVRRIADTRSLTHAVARLTQAGRIDTVSTDGAFCRRVEAPEDVPALEHAYIRRLNGDEYAMTKVLRRQSVYLTRAFLRTSLSPNQITLLSLAVSVPAALGVAAGGYWIPLAGAALYYLSTLLDCCDGEVARCSFRSSAFGCWLETASDYLSTALIFGGVVAGVVIDPVSANDRAVAAAGGLATLALILLLSYQRRRVAQADPDAYERIFKSRIGGGRGDANLMGRFTVWGLQFIKRASVAHVLLFLALVGQVRVIVYLWTFASVLAVPIALAVHLALVGGRRAPATPVGIGVERGGLS